VTAKIDKKAGVGHLSCKVCDQSFSCSINCTQPPRESGLVTMAYADLFAPDLSLPVDVYSEWVDACDTVAQENKEANANRPRNFMPPGRAGEPERVDDDLDDEDADRHNGYGGEGIVDDDEDDY
jgi:transcription elongation factor Elf1